MNYLANRLIDLAGWVGDDESGLSLMAAAAVGGVNDDDVRFVRGGNVVIYTSQSILVLLTLQPRATPFHYKIFSMRNEKCSIELDLDLWYTCTVL